MLTGRDDAQWVEIQGVVRRFTVPNLHIMTEGGEIVVWIRQFGEIIPESLIDAG